MDNAYVSQRETLMFSLSSPGRFSLIQRIRAAARMDRGLNQLTKSSLPILPACV
jgi:hypothetical protein